MKAILARRLWDWTFLPAQVGGRSEETTGSSEKASARKVTQKPRLPLLRSGDEPRKV